MTTIDCRGERCPVPIVHTRVVLNALRKGDEVIIQADDPSFESEFLRFCQLADLVLLSKTNHPEFQEYHVKILR